MSGGLSQGSCLSPLLFFIIYTNSFHEFEDQFADADEAKSQYWNLILNDNVCGK